MVSGRSRQVRPCFGAGVGLAVAVLAAGGALTTLSVACSDVTGSVGAQSQRERQAVQSSGLGAFYGLAFTPAPSLAMLTAQHPSASQAENIATLARELAAQAEPYWASGAVTLPALTGIGGSPLFAPLPATNRIRYSCGATLVSPSYAITAGHCVTADSDVSAIKLSLYRPTLAFAKNYVPAALAGTFPSYSEPRVGTDDGYLVDQYDCTLLTRCYTGQDASCPATGKDMALLHCAGRPGDKYGFVNVGKGADPTGKEVLMHWKHEVLDLGGPESSLPADRVSHYVTRTTDISQNYHYFDGAVDLLPLRSIDWANGHPTKFVSSTAVDAHGCHGTSGSGFLARVGTSVEYELVGLAVLAGPAFGTRLCEQVPNPGGATSGEGTPALLFDNADPNDFLDLHAADVASDCQARAVAERDVGELPFAAGSHEVASIFSHLGCQHDAFGADGTVTADASFGPYPEKFVAEASGAIHALSFAHEADADYRFGAQVMPQAACSSGCGSLTLRVGVDDFSLAPSLTSPSEVAITFPSPGAGALALGIGNSGQARAFGGVVFIREGQVNSFDTLEDRLEAGLYALATDRSVLAGPLPMRFSGDGQAGFEAVLMPGERMALLRQALAAGHAWTVRLGSSSYTDLKCGLLDMAGARLAEAACTALMHFDDSGGTAARLGFYVELASGSARENAELRYVALASDAARDTDGDGVPEALDNCPGDWNGAQGDCSEEPPVGAGGSSGTGGSGGLGLGGDGEGGAATTDAGGAGGEDTAAAAGEGGGAGEASANANGGGGGSAGGSGGVAGATGVVAGASGAAGVSNTAGVSGSGVAGDAATAAAGGSAGATAGGAGASAGSSVSGAPVKPSARSGCACRIGTERSSASSAWLALGLGAVVLARRRPRVRPLRG